MRGPAAPYSGYLDLGIRRGGLAITSRVGIVWAADLVVPRGSGVCMTDLVMAQVGGSWPVETLTIEVPRERPRRRVAASTVAAMWDEADAITEAAIRRGVGVRHVPVETWARSIPKHIRANRSYAALTPSEVRWLSWDRLGPDARDAVGLALWDALRAHHPVRAG
jgi:hypothetical protein